MPIRTDEASGRSYSTDVSYVESLSGWRWHWTRINHWGEAWGAYTYADEETATEALRQHLDDEIEASRVPWRKGISIDDFTAEAIHGGIRLRTYWHGRVNPGGHERWTVKSAVDLGRADYQAEDTFIPVEGAPESFISETKARRWLLSQVGACTPPERLDFVPWLNPQPKVM